MQRLFSAVIWTVFLICLLTSSGQESPLGAFEGRADIGGPALAGSTTYDPAAQQYTLIGGGTNMWFGRDQFHFAWKRLKGNFILRTRLEFVGTGSDPHRKAGWIVRPTLEPDAPYADCAEHGDGLTSLQFRRAKGANTEQILLPLTNACSACPAKSWANASRLYQTKFCGSFGFNMRPCSSGTIASHARPSKSLAMPSTR